MWHLLHSAARLAANSSWRRPFIHAAALSLVIGYCPVNTAQAGSFLLEYHGCLMDKSGTPMPDGTYELGIKVYSDPTRLAPLWESDGPVSIELKDGCFAHVIGSTKPLPKPMREYTTVWVGITPETGREISPRTALDVNQSSSVAHLDKSSYPRDSEAGRTSNHHAPKGVFPDLYFHVGVSFGLGSTSPGESYEQFITPWQTGTGAGYGLGLAVGFRNIYQFQYRPRIVTSSDLNRFQADSVIPLDYHVNNEMVHKLNVLCFRRPTAARVPVIFLTFGTASTGSVRQVDKVGSGFVEGSSTMMGLEVGLLSKVTQLGLYLERRDTKFRNIYLMQLGTFQEEVQARFWSVGIQVSVGTGLFF